MYVNNKVYLENHDCEDCKNMSICKYCNDLKKKKKGVEKISGEPLSPVKVVVRCDNFEKK